MTQLHIYSSNCNDDLQDMVLGVADGTITDEKTIDKVFHHLNECTQCRQLYEDYFLTMEDEFNIDDDTFILDIKYQDNIFIPQVCSKYVVQSQVYVLENEKLPVVEIEYPYNDKIIKVKIIYNNKAIDVVIYSPVNGIKIHLLTGSRFDIATITNNTAQFSSVEPGNIVLLFDFKKIIKINITK